MKKIILFIAIAILVLLPISTNAQTDEQIRSLLVQKSIDLLVVQVNILDEMLTIINTAQNKASFGSFISLINSQIQSSVSQLSNLLSPGTDPIVQTPTQNTTPDPITVNTTPTVTPTPPIINTPEIPEPEVITPAQISGTVTASLQSYKSTISVGEIRNIVVNILFTNNRNERIHFQGRENFYLSFIENTVPNYSPRFIGVYKNQDLSSGTSIIAPNKSGVVRFFIHDAPLNTGTFKIRIDGYKVLGEITGERIEVEGMPITTGLITVE